MDTRFSRMIFFQGKFVAIKIACLMVSIISALACSANAQDVVTVGYIDNTLYRVSLDGSYSAIATIPSTPDIPSLSDVAVINQNSVVATGFESDKIYRINLNGTSSVIAEIAHSPGAPGLNGIAVLDKNNFVAVGETDSKVYRINSNGSYSAVATIPGDPGLSGVYVLDKNNIVTVGDNDNNVYSVNLNTGAVTLITPTAVPGSPALSDVASLDQNLCVTEGFDNHKLYTVNLLNGTVTEKTTIVEDAGLDGVVALDSNNVVTVGYQNNALYRVNLDGTYSLIAIIPNVPGLNGIDLLPSLIPTTGLGGNDLALADYFNNEAPPEILAYFQSDTANSLMKTAPTRNAFSTFASQTTQLLLSQQLNNHLHNKYDNLACLCEKPVGCCEVLDYCSNYTPWIGLQGDYAQGKAQHQTPGFRTGTGGVILGFDSMNFSNCNIWGAGLAYAHTNIQEKEGLGHANIDQGALVLYGMLSACNWYLDWSVWGGYYQSHNSRAISIPGFDGISRSNIHGWQLSPQMEIGYSSTLCEQSCRWWGLEPFTMVDWVNCWEHRFTEKGTETFDFEQQGKWCSLLRSEEGLRLIMKAYYDWGLLTARAKGSYAYQKAFRTGWITATLSGSSGFVNLKTLTHAQNMGVCGIDLLFAPWNRNCYGSIAYQGEFGSGYQSHEVMGTLSFDF